MATSATREQSLTRQIDVLKEKLRRLVKQRQILRIRAAFKQKRESATAYLRNQPQVLDALKKATPALYKKLIGAASANRRAVRRKSK